MAVSNKEKREWAWLPKNILDEILDKLISLSCYIRFAAVCKPWRDVALHQKLRRIQSCHKQLPLLMVPTQDKSHVTRGLYNVAERKLYRSKLKFPFNINCSGSSHGWLIFTEVDLAITLFDPFTGATISLPPIINMSGRVKNRDPGHLLNYRYYVLKVILSSDPLLSPDGCKVVAIYGEFCSLAFINLSDKSRWTYVNFRGHCLSDVIYHKGLVYVVGYSGGVVSVDTRDSKLRENKYLTRKLQVMRNDYEKPSTISSIIKTYLVTSPSGDLLQIIRFFRRNDEFRSMTDGFVVFKLPEDHLERPKPIPRYQLTVIKNLGDYAVFLGDNI